MKLFKYSATANKVFIFILLDYDPVITGYPIKYVRKSHLNY